MTVRLPEGPSGRLVGRDRPRSPAVLGGREAGASAEAEGSGVGEAVVGSADGVVGAGAAAVRMASWTGSGLAAGSVGGDALVVARASDASTVRSSDCGGA